MSRVLAYDIAKLRLAILLASILALASFPFFSTPDLVSAASFDTHPAGLTNPPAESSNAPIAAPDKLIITSLAAHEVKLAWSDGSDNEQGFKIERASDRLFSSNSVTFTVAMDVTHYSDQTVQPLTTYYYRVVAFNADGESSPTNVSLAYPPDLVPQSPGGLSASFSSAFQVELAWTDNSNNETGFKIERATSSSFAEGAAVFTVGANVRQCRDNTVPAGNYYYRVMAVNASGESAPSEAATVAVDSKIIEDNILFGVNTSDVAVSGFGTLFMPFVVDSRGAVQGQNVAITLGDASGRVEIAQTTKMLNGNGHALTTFAYSVPSLFPEPPAGKVLVRACEFGPHLATFTPPITVKLNFDAAALPGGTPVSSLQVGSWDGTGWEILTGSTIDTQASQMTVKVSHTSVLAVLGAKTTPVFPFAVSDLVIFPQYSEEGQPLLLQVAAKNNGTVGGNCELVLKLNDAVEQTHYVAIEAGGNYNEVFNLSNLKAGRYAVDINGVKSFLVVQAKVPSPTAKKSTPPATVAPASVTTASVPPATTLNEITIPDSAYVRAEPNWTLIIAIVGGMLFLILVSVVLFFVRR